MTFLIMLSDVGYGPTIEDWRAHCDRVLHDHGARVGLGLPRDQRRFGDLRDALDFDDLLIRQKYRLHREP